MKKKLYLLIVAILILTMLVACGGKTSLKIDGADNKQKEEIQKILDEKSIKVKKISKEKIDTDGDAISQALLDTYDIYKIDSEDGEEYRMSINKKDYKVFTITDSSSNFVYGDIGGIFGNDDESNLNDEEINPEQIVSDKLFEITNWLTLDIWNDGFCDLSHYIARGTNSTGGELDIDYTLHKLDNAIEKREDYNSFITGLDDNDRYKELKYIWTEKLYPEMESLYAIVKEKTPEPKDITSKFDTSKYSEYSSDVGDEISKIRDLIEQ